MHTYVDVLKEFKAFVPCDNTFHDFVIQDIDLETMNLKVLASY